MEFWTLNKMESMIGGLGPPQLQASHVCFWRILPHPPSAPSRTGDGPAWASLPPPPPTTKHSIPWNCKFYRHSVDLQGSLWFEAESEKTDIRQLQRAFFTFTVFWYVAWLQIYRLPVFSERCLSFPWGANIWLGQPGRARTGVGSPNKLTPVPVHTLSYYTGKGTHH